MGTIRILIVDDNSDFRECLLPSFLETLFAQDERHTIAIERAATALDGVSLACEGGGTYDLLLVDHRLGGESGITLIRFLREQRLTCKIIFLTSDGSETLQQALRTGADAALSKTDLIVRLPLALRQLQFLS